MGKIMVFSICHAYGIYVCMPLISTDILSLKDVKKQT
ncbi:MAG: hypothetical protein HW390_3416 [Candidatus Brocadiaceae bacterium]|nr:hypothetical protein [Candidatus Brocadiaceae bacterium]